MSQFFPVMGAVSSRKIASVAFVETVLDTPTITQRVFSDGTNFVVVSSVDCDRLGVHETMAFRAARDVRGFWTWDSAELAAEGFPIRNFYSQLSLANEALEALIGANEQD